MWDMTHPHVWHVSFLCVTWHDWCTCETWLIHIYDMYHFYAWHDSCTCETWLIHMYDMNDVRCISAYRTNIYFYLSIDTCHTCGWVMSHMYMSHVTHKNDTCHTCGWVMSHMYMSHVTHRNYTCHTCGWVMSHICTSISKCRIISRCLYTAHQLSNKAFHPISCSLYLFLFLYIASLYLFLSLYIASLYLFLFLYFASPIWPKLDPSEGCFGCHKTAFFVRNAFSWKPKKLTKSIVRLGDVSLFKIPQNIPNVRARWVKKTAASFYDSKFEINPPWLMCLFEAFWA